MIINKEQKWSNHEIRTLSIRLIDSYVLATSSQCGLVKGESGFLLFLMYEYKIYRDNQIKKQIYETVNQLIATWNHNYTLGYGITGLVWVLDILKREGFEFEKFDEWSEEIDILILIEARKMLLNMNFDYFNGVSGLLFYFLSKQKMTSEITSLFLEFIQILQLSKNKKSSFYYKEIESDFYVINLGVPHGITGIVLILLLIREQGLFKPQIDELIEYFVEKLLGFMSNNKGFKIGSLFYIENNYTSRSILAWCYGDLTTGYAIHKAGIKMKNSKWTSIGLGILEETVERTDIHTDSMVLCHGLPSIILIYNKIFEATNDNRYLHTANRWKNYCEMEILNSKDGNLKKTLENPSLFQGYPGLLLALNNDFQSWNECLLL